MFPGVTIFGVSAWKPTNIFQEAPIMEDTLSRTFFMQPSNPYHRRYEALRAVFVDGQSQKEAAANFGYSYGSLRQLIHEFRQQARGYDCTLPLFSGDDGRTIQRRRRMETNLKR